MKTGASAFDEIYVKMKRNRAIFKPESVSWTWGGYDQCEALFARLFCETDPTVHSFRMLPEYREVITWMTDTQGKGLFLFGDCGRGKSVIITGVVPVLLAMKGIEVRPYHAEQFRDKQTEVNPDSLSTVLDVLKHVYYPIVDDVGTEPEINEYGVRYEGFSQIINNAENRRKPVFVSTNLKGNEIADRYGLRTVDRIGRLCKIIKFEGESLR